MKFSVKEPRPKKSLLKTSQNDAERETEKTAESFRASVQGTGRADGLGDRGFLMWSLEKPTRNWHRLRTRAATGTGRTLRDRVTDFVNLHWVYAC